MKHKAMLLVTHQGHGKGIRRDVGIYDGGQPQFIKKYLEF